MGLALDTIVAFLFLVWLSLLAINVAGAARKQPKEYGFPKGRTLAIVPCRGIDLAMEQNLSSVKNQRCKALDVVAVVDSPRDPAVKVIRRIGMRCIVSSPKFREGSGKVRAIATALERKPGYDFYVVIDSDVMCKSNHVAELVRPLSDSGVGISTAYPYFQPVGGFWSMVKMVWSFVGNGMMKSEITRFGWGGSIAFRKGLLDKDHFNMFCRSVSDDIALVRAARDKGLRIEYVNKGTITVSTADSFSEFVEWSNRQTALSVSGNRRILQMGLLFYGCNVLLIIMGVLLSVLVSYAYIILLLPLLLGMIKAYRRARKHYILIPLIYIMIDFILLANLVAASRMDSITWRGRKYSLYGGMRRAHSE